MSINLPMNTGTAKPAIFLDRDGTIIEDRGHLSGCDEVNFFPFTVEALTLLQEHFLLFIVTNQSGISLGRVSREEVDRVNDHVLKHLKNHGIAIQQLYCCSHKRDDHCECIKPKPYFINEAMRAYNLDIAQSFSIGDHPHDVDFCKNAGGNGLYVLTGHGTKHFATVGSDTQCFENLLDAARWVLKKPVG